MTIPMTYYTPMSLKHALNFPPPDLHYKMQVLGKAIDLN